MDYSDKLIDLSCVDVPYNPINQSVSNLMQEVLGWFKQVRRSGWMSVSKSVGRRFKSRRYHLFDA